MSLHLHIERVIVDGLPISAVQTPALRAQIQAQLRELLADFRARAGYAVPALRAEPVTLPRTVSAQVAGNALARSLHAVLADSPRSPRSSGHSSNGTREVSFPNHVRR